MLYVNDPLSEDRQAALAALRTKYQSQGFTFMDEPRADQLPAFFQGFIPDAVASKPGNNVAFEIRERSATPVTQGAANFDHIFDAHPDWTLRVMLLGGRLLHPRLVALDRTTVLAGAREAKALLIQDHAQAAFLLAWSVLEAALRDRDASLAKRPLSAASLVETLAMYGYVDPDVSDGLRALIETRNRIAHGDLTVTPTEADVRLVIAAVEATLDADMS